MANNILPGEHDWMYQVPGANPGMGMGFPAPAPARGPGILDHVGGMLGGGPSYGGLLGAQDQAALKKQALMTLGANLLANSGPSPTRVSFGQALGNSLLATQQSQQQAGQDMLQAMLLKTKMQQANQQQRKNQVVSPGGAVVDETGKVIFQNPSAGAQDTSDIANWKFFQSLTPEQQKKWLAMQRQPTAPQLAVINGVPTLVDRIEKTTTPLSTLQQEIGATTEKAGAEAEAKALGAAKGEAQGGLAKKGINAMNVLETIDLADPLIDVATGSATGAAADKVASFFGTSTTGDQAIAQLKIVQANLMTNMPRMEGPQSDRDVQLYREAAGEIGDPNVPRARKKAALKMIEAINQKYVDGGPVQGQVRGNSPTQPRSFASEAEAAAAGLKPGTRIIINGVSGTWK